MQPDRIPKVRLFRTTADHVHECEDGALIRVLNRRVHSLGIDGVSVPPEAETERKLIVTGLFSKAGIKDERPRTVEFSFNQAEVEQMADLKKRFNGITREAMQQRGASLSEFKLELHPGIAVGFHAHPKGEGEYEEIHFTLDDGAIIGIRLCEISTLNEALTQLRL